MDSLPNIEELKDLVAARLSVEEILDILGWTNIDLVNELEEHIEENIHDFISAIK
jgi:hypothetical protein